MRARVKALRDPRKALLITIGAAILVVAVIAAWTLTRGGGPVFGQSFTIGFVDMQRALDAHPRKVPSERALQEFFAAKQREFAQRAKGMTAEQRQLLDRELQQQFVEKRQQLLAGLDTDIRNAVEQIAKTDGIGIVLERAVVLFGGVDLTEQVIKRVTGK